MEKVLKFLPHWSEMFAFLSFCLTWSGKISVDFVAHTITDKFLILSASLSMKTMRHMCYYEEEWLMVMSTRKYDFGCWPIWRQNVCRARTTQSCCSTNLIQIIHLRVVFMTIHLYVPTLFQKRRIYRLLSDLVRNKCRTKQKFSLILKRLKVILRNKCPS